MHLSAANNKTNIFIYYLQRRNSIFFFWKQFNKFFAQNFNSNIFIYRFPRTTIKQLFEENNDKTYMMQNYLSYLDKILIFSFAKLKIIHKNILLKKV